MAATPGYGALREEVLCREVAKAFIDLWEYKHRHDMRYESSNEEMVTGVLVTLRSIGKISTTLRYRSVCGTRLVQDGT